MDALIQLPADFPYLDLMQIAKQLKRADVFVPGYRPAEAGLYNPECFLFEHRVLQIEHCILPDRNLVSRMAQVARGERLDTHRHCAAALMAYAQCLNIQFDPSIAFHELAHNEGNEAALTELRWFRSADSARPQHWVDLAVGRIDRLPVEPAPPILETMDLAKPLRRWRRNYVVALKLAELELSNRRSIDKQLELADWMSSDFIVAGPAALFAALYFSPRFPRRGMIKQLRAANRERALVGVRNAAWDITYLSEFVGKVNASTTTSGESYRYILASMDQRLRSVATTLLAAPDPGADRAEAVEVFAKWWHREDAETIVTALVASIETASRRMTMAEDDREPVNVSGLIRAGEDVLRGQGT